MGRAGPPEALLRRVDSLRDFTLLNLWPLPPILNRGLNEADSAFGGCYLLLGESFFIVHDFVLGGLKNRVYYANMYETCCFSHCFAGVKNGAQKRAIFCSFLHFFAKLKIPDVKRHVFLQKNRRHKIGRRGKGPGVKPGFRFAQLRQKWRISASPRLKK